MLLPIANIVAGQERDSARGMAAIADLLAPIPRLEEVRFLLQQTRASGSGAAVLAGKSDAERANLDLAAAILRVAADFERLESEGSSSVDAARIIAGRDGAYPRVVQDALIEVRGQGRGRETRELNLEQLKPGMVFAEDVRTYSNMLLVARGHEVTQVLIDRLNNYPLKTVREPIRVYL